MGREERHLNLKDAWGGSRAGGNNDLVQLCLTVLYSFGSSLGFSLGPDRQAHVLLELQRWLRHRKLMKFYTGNLRKRGL